MLVRLTYMALHVTLWPSGHTAADYGSPVGVQELPAANRSGARLSGHPGPMPKGLAYGPSQRLTTTNGTSEPSLIEAYLQGIVETIRGLDHDQLAVCFDVLWGAWQSDRTVFIIGNGGSASTASHMANDLSKQTHVPGRRPFRAHALTDNVETLTAIANDTGYENVFASQLKTHARTGDVLVLI